MGVATSEVGYTSAMPRREDHEVHKGHVVAWGGGRSGIHLCFVLDFAFASYKRPVFGTFSAKLHSHFLSLQHDRILDLNCSNSSEWCEPNIIFENGDQLSYYAASSFTFFPTFSVQTVCPVKP